MTREELTPGDLVEDDRGKRWIIGKLIDWSRSGHYVWGWPATKSGKQDQRKDGQYLRPEVLKKV